MADMQYIDTKKYIYSGRKYVINSPKISDNVGEA